MWARDRSLLSVQISPNPPYRSFQRVYELRCTFEPPNLHAVEAVSTLTFSTVHTFLQVANNPLAPQPPLRLSLVHAVNHWPNSFSYFLDVLRGDEVVESVNCVLIYGPPPRGGGAQPLGAHFCYHNWRLWPGVRPRWGAGEELQ